MAYSVREERQSLAAHTSSMDFQEIDALQQQWLRFRKQREQLNPNAYKAFLARLDRRWAIETGIIEGLYNIDRGTTQTLVEHGLIADLIDRTAADRDPQDIVKVLKDHQDSAEFVTESIRQKRPLSGHYIRELHQLLTRNQAAYSAVNQFGHVFEAELDRGGFKKQPNNPTRPDGQIHEYCPPDQVESEIDNLVNFYREFEAANDSCHQLLIAAWLHHRFTQIHPFQDGNGRVARALLTWHLAKEEYLPIVVTRDDRKRYIECLESADAGDLNPFVQFIVRLERQIILEALGEPEPVTDAGMVSQVLDHIAEQIRRRQQDRLEQLRSVNDVASSLRDRARAYLESQAEPVRQRLGGAGLAVECVIDVGGPDNNKEHWYRAQVVQTAKDAGHWANWNEDRFFIKLSINPENRSQIPRLIFVVSLHHAGRQLTGIMAATAFTQIVKVQGHRTEDSEEPSDPDFHNCTVDSFTFTWDSDVETVAPRFTTWIEAPLSIALRHWSGFIS
ncbi:MAG: Fic family protein [Caldilineaceae bacterium SB0665_bin_25]|nr:Fic family protein [Caldilineaceae bacterium SB0665_bin_25]